MPTPFTHLAFARRLLADQQQAPALRTLVETQWPAFLLGSVAADGHVLAGVQREDTHFYSYDRAISQHPWRVMVNRHPALLTPESAAQQSCIAAYIAHLSMDEIWSLKMLRPQFVEREWAPRQQRFVMLHVLLIAMDERDQVSLPATTANDLHAAHPRGWLPFMGDDALNAWGDLIYRQLVPGGVSETLDIFGPRINMTPPELRAILDSPEHMEQDLWAHIPPSLLKSIEDEMYHHAVAQMTAYLHEAKAPEAPVNPAS